jgi:serine/threonine protein kinase/Tol biopolymer transport system component
MELAPDNILRDRYKIIHPLGKGGMGAVYLALDTSLDHQVAVKSNRNPAVESTNQFLREAKLLANLRHPNLPRVSDYFIIEQNQYLVMDYIPGDDLSKMLEKQGPQPLKKVMHWAEELGSALVYLHNQNPPVIHRDIKPANLKLTNEGEIVLVDFGIAKATDSSQATATGALGYTPGYAPPEQYGGGHTGPHSDQYSMASTLYHMLTGEKPADSVQRVMEQAVLTPIHLLLPDIPEHIRAALEKALSIRPQDRFENVNEFIKALKTPSAVDTQARPQVPAVPAFGAEPTIYTGGDSSSADATVALPHLPVPPPPGAHPIVQPMSGVPPKKRLSVGWILAGVAVLVIGGVVVIALAGGLFLFTRSQSSATPTSLALVLPDTPVVQADTPVPTRTPAPSSTPEPGVTPLPSETPTLQLNATATPLALGGGKLLAFSSDRGGDGFMQIWTLRAFLDNSGKIVTTDLSQVTSGEGDKTQPAWSPDGRYLLYIAPGGKEGIKDYGLDIFKLDLQNPDTPPVNLTRKVGDDTYPSWSPDGKRIAFTNNGRGDKIRQILVMDSAGLNMVRISADRQEYSGVWSPDSQWLLFVLNASDNEYLYLRTYTDDYATPMPYDKSQIFGRLGNVMDPAWSPDGLLIAYVKKVNASRQIYSVEYKSLGGKIVLLSGGNNSDTHPAWSPDNQWIAFTSQRDNNAEVYIMTSTGLLQSNLTNSPDVDQDPAWQP